jgi:hypothetical protein
MLFAPPVLEPAPPPEGTVEEAASVDELVTVVRVVLEVVVVAPLPPPLPVPGRHCE